MSGFLDIAVKVSIILVCFAVISFLAEVSGKTDKREE